MVADAMTKALPSAKVKHFGASFGLRRAWGGVLEWRRTISGAACGSRIWTFLIGYPRRITRYFSGFSFHSFTSLSAGGLIYCTAPHTSSHGHHHHLSLHTRIWGELYWLFPITFILITMYLARYSNRYIYNIYIVCVPASELDIPIVTPTACVASVKGLCPIGATVTWMAHGITFNSNMLNISYYTWVPLLPSIKTHRCLAEFTML